MGIIPHNGAFAQVEICPKNKRFPEGTPFNQKPTFKLSHIQQQALVLYDEGLNVLPQPLGQKGGYPWKQLQYTRLDREDHLHGLLPLFAGQCNIAIMCGRTSGNLFVIDCESTTSFTYHLKQMEQRDIPIWAVETARGGHIYLRCVEGEIQNIKTGLLPATEIKGQDGYVLAPPSIHPSGSVYRWHKQDGTGIPLVSVQDINWLYDQNGNQIKLTYTYVKSDNQIAPWKLSNQRTFLSHQTRDYLENGHSVSEGQRNNRLFSAACDLAGNNYDESQAFKRLYQTAIASGLSSEETNQTIQSAFSKDRQPASKHSQPTETWEYAFYFLTQTKWSGRGSHTKRALFIALIECARRSNNDKGIFRASIRELSQLARIGTATVQRLLPTFLTDIKPLLFNCGNDRNSRASLWKFSDYCLQIGKQTKLNMDTSPLLPPWLSYSVSIFNSDLAEREGVGLGGLYLYMMLQTQKQPLMPSAIAELLNMTVNQVNYALAKLQSANMVMRESRGWRVITVVFEEVAQRMGVVGKGLARAQRYIKERSVFVGKKIYESRLDREAERFFGRVKQFSRSLQRLSEYVGRLLDDPLLCDSLVLGGEILWEDVM